MNRLVNITMDGQSYQVKQGKNLVDVAREHGLYIPTLCHFREVNPPLGTCRICTVQVDGKTTSACTTKVYEGMKVHINTPELLNTRKAIIEMLFAEGNHFCPSCEKSGNCDMQNLGYEMGITVSRFPHVYSEKLVDYSSERMAMDANRCILCKRCVEDVKNKDGKDIFSFVRRGVKTRVHIDHEEEEKLSDAEAKYAMDICPVGAILIKGTKHYQTPGGRKYDTVGRLKHFPQFQQLKPKKKNGKFTVATTSLAGCFGCHMSLLDIDTAILNMFEVVEFNKSPLNDIKNFTKQCDIGLIEGGCANSENIEVLKEFRKKCNILVVLGECAIMGGIPAMRNFIPLKDCLEEAYINGLTAEIGTNTIPCHEDIPKVLNRVYPCNEVVKVDHYIPGCPPDAQHIWKAVKNILLGEEYSITSEEFKYD